MTTSLRAWIPVLCVLALTAYAGRASAVTVTALSASTVVAARSASDNALVLDVALTNASSVLTSRVSVSAIAVDSGPLVVTLVSTAYGNIDLSDKLPNGLGAILTRSERPIPEPRSVALFVLGGLLVFGAVYKRVLTAR